MIFTGCSKMLWWRGRKSSSCGSSSSSSRKGKGMAGQRSAIRINLIDDAGQGLTPWPYVAKICGTGLQTGNWLWRARIP